MRNVVTRNVPVNITIVKGDDKSAIAID